MPGILDQLIADLKKAQEKANRLNEERYQQALGLFEKFGQAGMARIGKAETRQQAAATQSLISRGLGNVTITEAARRGIAGQAETSRQELGERVAFQKAGLMERRTDLGPDLGMFAGLISAAAQQESLAGKTVIRGGLGPMASEGLDVFGRPLGRFGGGGGGGSGGGGGGRLGGSGGGGGNRPGGPVAGIEPGTGTLELGADRPIVGMGPREGTPDPNVSAQLSPWLKARIAAEKKAGKGSFRRQSGLGGLGASSAAMLGLTGAARPNRRTETF